MNMEIYKESHHALNNILDEMPQNKYETITSNELLEESKDDYWNTTDKTDLRQNVLCNLQRDVYNQSDSEKKKTYTMANNEFLNEESLYKRVNKEARLQSSHSSKKENNEQNIHTTFNESAASNDSSSDEEVLQTRFPVHSDDECNSPKSSLTFASISDKENNTENNSEMKKPIIIQAKAYIEKETFDCEFNDSNSEIIKQAEENEHQDINRKAEKNEHQDINRKAEKNEHQDTNKKAEKNEHQYTNKKAEKNEHQHTNKKAEKNEHQYTNEKAKKNEHQNTDKQPKKHEYNDVNKQIEKNERKKDTIDVANSLSVEADNSNIETESSYRQNSIKIKNTDLNFDKIKDISEISPENVLDTEKKENTFNQSIQDPNAISPDTIIKDFFNGSFDISIFKPNKNSTMIDDDKTIRKQKESIKDYSPSKERKYRKNVHKNTNEKIHSDAYRKTLYNDNKHFLDSADDSMIHLKRRISENQAENAKKAKKITEKNKDEITSIASDNFNKYVLKPETKSENKYSKVNNQHKRVSSRSKYNDRDIKLLNNFDMENNKKNKIKNTARIKSQKNEELFKGSSNKIPTLKKTRNLRNSSLIASKKIKEIEKLENVDSDEEIVLDSGSSCFDSNIKKIENSFKNIFKDKNKIPKYKAGSKIEKEKFYNDDTIDVISLDDSQACLEKEEKLESTVTRSNRKRKSKFENILDAYRISNKCQLKMNNVASKEIFISDINQSNLLMKENEDAFENHQTNKKRAGNKRQNKNNELTRNKSPEYNKKIDKTAPYKDDRMNVNYGVITRSKKKTWDTLEKELLGESNDVAKTALLKEKSTRRRNLKDIDLYSVSDKSMMPISMPIKSYKYDGKYKIQNTEFEHLQTPVNKVQSSEIIPYKSKNILEKTIAAMEKCTANFIAPKEKFTEKEWIYSEAEFDDMIDEMSIDQEAEFHSNMTFVKNENEQYYKNKIVAILKQSSSKKIENVRRTTRYNSGEFKYDFGDSEHVVKKSIITETYSLRGNSEGNLKADDQALIPPSDGKESEPWTRLIKELNLEESKNENRNKDTLIGTPSKKTLIYHENVKQYTNELSNIDTKIQFTMNLKERKECKQDEIEKEESEQEITNSAFEKNLLHSNRMAIAYDLNVRGNCTAAIGTEPNKDEDLDNICTREKLGKTSRKIVTKQRQVLRMKKQSTSPKFKLQVVDDGGIKFKRCNRSFSSSSEESVKRKQGNARKDEKKLPKDEQNSERQKYKRYLTNLFDGENSVAGKKIEKDKSKTKCMTKEKNHKNNLVKESDEQGRMFKALIAKDDDDVFSISSSDSEAVNKGSGLMCDLFDE